MNFMDVDVIKRGDTLYLNEGMFEIKLPQEVTEKAMPFTGRKAVLGLRPTPEGEIEGLDLSDHGEEGYILEAKG